MRMTTQAKMTKFFKTLWRVITFPFVLLFNIIAFPFQMIGRIGQFLNEEPPEDRPLMDTFSSLASEAEARASLWEHIEALRMHLLRIVIALALGVGISSLFTRSLAVLLAAPLEGTSLLGTIEVTESVSVFMRIALISGVILALPYLAFELWLFAAPGLRPRERKIGLLGIPLAALFFASGVAFTYYIMPAAIRAMEGFNQYMGFTTNWRPNSYYGFITGLMFWLGVFFEFPLVIYILTSIGLVKPSVLAQQWRLAIVIISIVAALVTPTIDPVNMALVMLPMSLLYFISIGLSYIAYAGRRRNAPETESSV
ncbi:MAG: twin-arginine translocase subunit TatC [Chloroflexi bacterium]|nr:MAG: twin-arginine translocase subunit TatC [Chloroflexota bacterium]